jgi:hypothetical protein
MAYDFNGTTQSLTANSAVVTSTPLTIAVWCNFDVVTGASKDIVALSSKTAQSIYRLNLNPTNTPPMRIVDRGGASTASQYLGSPSAGVWFHYAGVFTSTTSRTPFFNGSAGATNTTLINHPTLPDSTSISGFFDGISSISQRCDGKIAEVGIWDAALTAAEVASLAKGMTCDKIRPQSLVFYAPLVRNLQDAKGGLTITNNGGATVATHPRVYA